MKYSIRIICLIVTIYFLGITVYFQTKYYASEEIRDELFTKYLGNYGDPDKAVFKRKWELQKFHSKVILNTWSDYLTLGFGKHPYPDTLTCEN